jgi:hypothetical protein
MSTRSRLLAALAGLCVVLPVGTVVGNAAPMPPACEIVLVSPEYRQDATVLCIYRTRSDADRLIGVSRDRGRTWRTPTMTGLTRPAGPAGTQLSAVLSPGFAIDHSLFVTTGSGTFVSTDLGETFVLVDALATGAVDGNPVAFMKESPVWGDHIYIHRESVALLFIGGIPALVDVTDRVHQLVPGVPGRGASLFVVAPNFHTDTPGLAFAHVPTAGASAPGTLAVYGCDASFTCAEQRFVFPEGLELLHDALSVRLMLDGSYVVLLRSSVDYSTHVWRSTDGRTFVPWSAAERLVAPVSRASGQLPEVSVAPDPVLPKRAYLRVEGYRSLAGPWAAGAPPASQIFRTDDGGATWHRIAFGRGLGQAGPRGTIPWVGLSRGSDRAHIQVAPDGRIFAVGDAGSVTLTTFCSLDGGAHWTVGCPR